MSSMLMLLSLLVFAPVVVGTNSKLLDSSDTSVLEDFRAAFRTSHPSLSPQPSGSPSESALPIEPTTQPSVHPAALLESQYRAVIGSVFPQANEPGSSHDLALQWMVFEDPLGLSPNDPGLLQRYIVALFWYLTTSNGESPWRSCNKPGPGEGDDCIFQVFIRTQNDAVTYIDQQATRWLSGTNECDWVRITCDERNDITGIDLCEYQQMWKQRRRKG